MTSDSDLANGFDRHRVMFAPDAAYGPQPFFLTRLKCSRSSTGRRKAGKIFLALSVDAQVRQLRAAGAKKVFREAASGAKTDRPQLRRFLAEVGPGDMVMVTRLDRLARSTRDLLNTLAAITGKKAGFRSLADAWADTTAHGRLMLTVLGGLAEFERELIRARTGEGRARAKANGQSLGRPFKLTPHQRSEAIRRRDRGETLSNIARSYNVHPSTISRLTA
jgi:DNA invertase Pin-like site-specific DNA recombinase